MYSMDYRHIVNIGYQWLVQITVGMPTKQRRLQHGQMKGVRALLKGDS